MMTDKKRVEITEETGVKLGRLSYSQGDTVTMDADIADMVISNGWGKDAETGETGERKAGSVKIEVDSVIQKLETL